METELSWATTEQLVEELMKRRLFVGVLIHNCKEVRNKKRGILQSQDGNDFRVKWTPNLTWQEANVIVERAGEALAK